MCQLETQGVSIHHSLIATQEKGVGRAPPAGSHQDCTEWDCDDKRLHRGGSIYHLVSRARFQRGVFVHSANAACAELCPGGESICAVFSPGHLVSMRTLRVVEQFGELLQPRLTSHELCALCERRPHTRRALCTVHLSTRLHCLCAALVPFFSLRLFLVVCRLCCTQFAIVAA